MWFKMYGALHPTSHVNDATRFDSRHNTDNKNIIGAKKQKSISVVLDLGYHYKVGKCYVFSTCSNLKTVHAVGYSASSPHPQPQDFHFA